MATKTVKKNELPKITKKWFEFKIDPKTLRPIQFGWSLASGYKTVDIYNDNKDSKDRLHLNLRNYVASYYFVLDKTNKRIFAYPIVLSNNDTRANCVNAHYEKLNTKSFYMWDENKQLWEIPYGPYRRWVRYDYTNNQPVYEEVKDEPRKLSRLSTMCYKVQAQTPNYLRKIFSELYGSDFVYQNYLITDDNIRRGDYRWIGWLQSKGRKYSAKTIQTTEDLMNKISSDSRWYSGEPTTVSYPTVTLESINGVTAICYYSENKETFRQVFNEKTTKIEHFIWKNDKWQKSSQLSQWQSIARVDIKQSYAKAHPYDYAYLKEASEHYINKKGDRGYWYSPERNLYDFVLNYITKPVVHQILQISNYTAKDELFKNKGDITAVYGKIPNRGKTMYAKLGINKYQFENPEIILYMKWLLNCNNISHIDNETWNKCRIAFRNEKPNSGWHDREILDFLRSHKEFSLDRWIKICKLSKDHSVTQTGYYRQDTVKQLYKDYYKSLDAINEFGMDVSTYPLFFNDKDQLQRFHDEAARAVSNVRNKAQDEKFTMLYNKRIKMLENDDNYLIDMPKCSADLTEEGSKLRHCVGGYVNSVANGSTAIYFLRQASEPSTPWLTVEVSNKRCRQIHGSCNAWMGSKDEYFDAVPFLVYWFEKHGIEYDDNLLTNMATGYGSISQRRSMPTAKIKAYAQARKSKK
jgi:hypothetical protein